MFGRVFDCFYDVWSRICLFLKFLVACLTVSKMFCRVFSDSVGCYVLHVLRSQFHLERQSTVIHGFWGYASTRPVKAVADIFVDIASNYSEAGSNCCADLLEFPIKHEWWKFTMYLSPYFRSFHVEGDRQIASPNRVYGAAPPPPLLDCLLLGWLLILIIQKYLNRVAFKQLIIINFLEKGKRILRESARVQVSTIPCEMLSLFAFIRIWDLQAAKGSQFLRSMRVLIPVVLICAALQNSRRFTSFLENNP